MEGIETSEGEHEENEFGDGDHNLALPPLHEGFAPELHVPEEEEEEEGAQFDDEVVYEEVLLGDDCDDDDGNARQEVEDTVASRKEWNIHVHGENEVAFHRGVDDVADVVNDDEQVENHFDDRDERVVRPRPVVLIGANTHNRDEEEQSDEEDLHFTQSM